MNETDALHKSIGQVILGKDDVIELILICLVTQGHILIEDVPGVGKTTLALSLAKSIDGTFQRIQFTSDLLPSDVIGVPIYNSKTHGFEFKPGPIFANVVLADEINRTTPKTQSALLEAMQDGHVTVDRVTHELEKPFMVVATQNPTEFHGTYPLPESQLDRFMMRITMGYPSKEEEARILQNRGSSQIAYLKPVCDAKKILELQHAASKVRVDDSITKYILELVDKTRKTKDLELGVSPRGALSLHRAVQGKALIHGRDFVIPDDVKDLALPVLSHRLIVSGQKSSTRTSYGVRTISQEILQEIINSTEVPM